MENPYRCITEYLTFLQRKYGVQVCVKDFCGFIPINKQLDEALRPFLAHTNPFCLYMKSTQNCYHVCLRMIRRIHDKCEAHPGTDTFFGICHAGLGEYVVPVRVDGLLLGSVNAGFFQTDERRTEYCIRRACRSGELDADTALALYRGNIESASADTEDMLSGLCLLAEYLGETYRVLQDTRTTPNLTHRYRNCGRDEIISHAIEYIRQNVRQPITVEELAAFCHCSSSYLSRVFHQRTGVNINLYVNKVRVEISKNYLMRTSDSVAEIALNVGFGDPNYFSRVFTQVMGIPPTEFRRRFQEEENPPAPTA